MKYKLESFGDSKNRKIALLALSNGHPQDKVIARIESLVDEGLYVMVPRYENGELLVEPDSKRGSAELAGSFSNAVSPETGAAQIIECIEKGIDIYAFMGGWTCKDKINEVIDYFENNPDKKPKKPIKVFGFSDSCFMTVLQSYLPDCVEFIAAPVSSVFSKHGDLEYERQAREVRELLKGGVVPKYERKILSGDFSSLNGQNAQYYAYHHDNIWAEVYPDKVKMPNGGKLYNLKTDRPYIVSFDGFLQIPAQRKYFDGNSPKFLRMFLEKKSKLGQLPLAVEIGLFATRMDGNNGYCDLLHDKESGLIDLDNESNIDKICEKRDELREQIIKINQLKEEFESGEKDDNINSGEVLAKLTTVPKEVNEKVLKDKDYELTKEDIKLILAHENQKIKKHIDEMVEVCEKFNVPVITNHRYGHTTNMSVVGGGEVKIDAKENSVELEYLPKNKAKTNGSVEVSDVSKVSGNEKQNTI